MSSEDKDREVWRRYWTFWYEQRQQEADAAKRLAEDYGATFPAFSCERINVLIPAGWQIVPKTPTVEMLEAWACEGLTVEECNGMLARYEDMLEAAPKLVGIKGLALVPESEATDCPDCGRPATGNVVDHCGQDTCFMRAGRTNVTPLYAAPRSATEEAA